MSLEFEEIKFPHDDDDEEEETSEDNSSGNPIILPDTPPRRHEGRRGERRRNRKRRERFSRRSRHRVASWKKRRYPQAPRQRRRIRNTGLTSRERALKHRALNPRSAALLRSPRGKRCFRRHFNPFRTVKPQFEPVEGTPGTSAHVFKTSEALEVNCCDCVTLMGDLVYADQTCKTCGVMNTQTAKKQIAAMHQQILRKPWRAPHKRNRKKQFWSSLSYKKKDKRETQFRKADRKYKASFLNGEQSKGVVLYC